MGRLPAGVRRRNNGRYEKRFTVNGVRYSVYSDSLDELIKEEIKKREEIQQGIYINADKITLDLFFERYEKAKSGTVKDSTLYTDKQLYKAISAFQIDRTGKTLGTLKLKEIETQNVRDFQKEQFELLGAPGANRRTMFLKMILNEAIKERLITWNPCTPIKTIRNNEKRAVDTYHRALTREETKKFLECLRQNNSYYENILRFMLYSGCRIGEALALQKSDIDRINNVIHINRTITKDEDGANIMGTDTKTKSGKRNIPLTNELKQVLFEQMEINKALQKRNFYNIIFQSAITGTIIQPERVNKEIKRMCKLAGLEHFTSHALRDTFATRAIESGMNPKTLQMILGHSDISMTMNLYCHVMEDTKSEEMKNIKVV